MNALLEHAVRFLGLGAPLVQPTVALSTRVVLARDKRLVRLAGAVTAHDDAPPLIAPLSGRRCLYYRIQIEARGNKRWAPVVDEWALCRVFWLQDESGRALVDLGDTLPEIAPSLVPTLPPWSGRPTPHVERLLRERELVAAELLNSARRYRHREALLVSNERLAVIGFCRREPDPDPQSAGDYRGRATRVRLVPPWSGALRVLGAG